MKRHIISTIFILILLAPLISCTTTPEFSAYQSKPARETAVISGQLLVETEWIPASGSNPKLRLIDFGRNGADYQAGHIPGAAFMDRKAVWNKVNGIPGMLPSVETMAAELEKAGVNNDSTVVIYDSNSGLWASRLFWALQYLGHADTHILNGGWAKWIRENRAVQTASYLPPRGKFIPHIQPDLLATENWILENLNNPELQIIDTRSPGEYAGEDVRAAQGGHIPGAVNINWISNLKSDGSKTFAPEADLTNLYDSKKISKDKIIVTLCQTGVRGAHTYFVLKHLGYPRVRVYDGSWAEWGNDIRTSVITESTAGRK